MAGTKTITSDKSETKVGASGTKIWTSTRVTYSFDDNGTIDPEKTKKEILYYKTPLTIQPEVGATQTGTSKEWEFRNLGGIGQPVLGADAQKSLKEGALKSTTQQQIQSAATKQGLTSEQQKTLNPNNTATTPSVTAQQISDSTAAKEKGGTRNEFRGKGGNGPLKYPIKLNDEHQDVIKFSMVKYSPKKFNEEKFGLEKRNEQRDIIGVVVLPVPSGISDTNSVSWSGAEMNAAEAIAANIAMTTIGEGVTAGADAIASAAEKISANYKDVGTAIKAAFVNAAVGTNGILTRTTGLILNPNMELLFNSPTLRPFDFSFKLSARSKEEAQAIRSIIRFFKQGMSPIRTESNLFLKSPHTFQLEYLHKKTRHPFLNKFKECALTSFSVDYTPEGQYATFSDGAMVSYQIRMQFQELEPVFNDEYTQGAGSTGYDAEIGY